MAYIKNGAPQVILLGADDKSGRVITPESEPIPQHCPLFYIFAEKGSTERLLVSSGKLTSLYGSKTFDSNEKFFNHQTRYLMGVSGEANTCMIQRLVPKDAGTRANAVVYIDVLPTQVPNYVRDSYGSYVVDPQTNKYKIDPVNPTINGYTVKYIKETLTDDVDAGTLKPKSGTMSNTLVSKQTFIDSQIGKVNGLRSKFKVGEVINFKSLIESDAEFTVYSSNQSVINYDQADGNWKANGVGTTTLTITFIGKDKVIDNNIKINVTVVNEMEELLEEQQFTISGIQNVLTKEQESFTVSVLDITGAEIENAVVTVGDANVARVSGKTVVASTNGSTYVTVYLPATDEFEGTTIAFTIQSKIIDLPDVEEEKTSTMYPLFQIKAKYQGAYYNNLGFSIGSLYGDEVDNKIVTATKSMLFKLALFTRTSSSASPTTFRSLYSEPYVNFSFKEKAINPNTEARIDFEEVYEKNWFNETDSLKPLKYFDYEYFHFYREYFEEVCKMILEKEIEYVSDEDKIWDNGRAAATSSWYDFTTANKDELANEYYIINPFSCKTSNSVNYFTVMRNDDNPKLTGNQKEVLFNFDTPIFLEGGSDGTINNEVFEELVIEKMKDYNDADSEVQDLAVNVESCFYDSGFTLPTKKELINFITLRKDTDIVLSTHDDSLGEKTLNLSDARAVAEALKARYKLAPESEYFGTSVARGIVVMGSGKIRDGSTKNRIPNSYEIAIKTANMMGSSSGNWDSRQIFDKYPGNSLNLLIDPQPSFIPAGIKPTLWNDGIVWVQPYDRETFHFPALQTIYEDDTSVLNNFFVMKALGQLSKMSDRVWRRYTGTASMDNNEFIEEVTRYCNELIKGKFDGVVTVIPDVVIDDEDELRGYSWHIVWKLYGDNMKTVLVASTEVYRSSDLTSNE